MPCDNAKTSSDIEHVDWNSSGQHYANVRFGSGSSQASQNSGDICRICHCESDPSNPLLTPCYCSGSLKYVHQACLQQWLTASETNSCELCKFPFIMHTKIKPFNEWRSLDISGIERRRLCCSVLFHCAAALCVIWSLCVLIERAADDVQRGLIDWPFWTKLAVVTVGLTGGIVFMYIQCKAYLHLCHRWKARNRILLIQNAPEKIHPLAPPSPVATRHHQHFSEPLAHGGTSSGAVEINATGVAAAHATHDSSCSALENGAGTGGLHQQQMQQQQRLLNASPHHMLQLAAELEVPHSSSSACTQTEDALGQRQQLPGQPLGQVAVAANIECSQSHHNYDRDWALDDVVSQISSFRPCPQGSGSMTPFHDSIHNVLEHSEGSSRGSATDLCAGSRQDLSASGISTDTGREHALQLSSFSGSGEQKAPSTSSGLSHAVANGLGGFVYKPHQTKRYSNSSIFQENRDMLNDPSVSLDTAVHPYDYSTPPKIDYRHSSILGSDQPIGCCAADCLGKGEVKEELRRYSDPKLKASTADTVLDIDLPTSPLSPPAAYASQHPQPTLVMHRSFDRGVNGACAGPEGRCKGHSATDAQMDRSRLFFKSLPNLSSSCESLIKK
ncbi:GL22630 [Drosophila persimilis]|uniref:GL22630 n=1 Tax=Drosophila persimilis TaxID=7234 RepID=B4H1L7_DROPE|nr:GL22630 [Drosophila persimilis]